MAAEHDAKHNAPLPEGLEISGYRIVKKIAAGGFSIVYLAEDSTGIAVAIKEYLPDSLTRRAQGQLKPIIAADKTEMFRIGLKCFFDEGRALASIDHPNIVRVLNFFRANDTVYLVMGYERGRTLQEHIIKLCARKDNAIMSEATIRHLFAQIMEALREVHTRKLLHLDLKPANIYLRTDGTPILLDFGAARQILHADIGKLYPMYTPGFAAPELAYKKELGPWTDIYSIGAAIFNCMTGEPPQPAHERKKEDRMEAQFLQLQGMYSEQLIDLIRRSLMLDPLKRPQSVFALQKILRDSRYSKPKPNLSAGLIAQLRKLVGA